MWDVGVGGLQVHGIYMEVVKTQLDHKKYYL